MTDDSPANGPHIERYRDQLHWLARHYLKDMPRLRIDPSDVVHETLLRAHKNLSRFRGRSEAELFAWLRRILEHFLVDELRRRRHDPQLLFSLIRGLDLSSACLDTLVGADHTTPEEAALKHERLLRLSEAMSRLPEAERIAVERRYLQDPPASLADIAADLGRTPKAAAGLVARGLARLRKFLQEGDSDRRPE
jgi:RNA polymerase sigma-70 factor, ECF subfamily